MHVDVLSEALERIQFRAGIPGTAELRAPWGFHHPLPGQAVPPTDFLPDDLAKFVAVAKPRFGFYYIVTQGECLLELNGRDPIEVHQGDLVVLTPLSEHQLRDSHHSPVRPLFDYIPVHSMPHGPKLQIDGGGAPTTSIVFGGIGLLGYVGSQLLDSLPPLLHLNSSSDSSAWLPGILQIIESQSKQIEPGSLAIMNRLVQILFCQAVKRYVRQNHHRKNGANWLQASLDHQIGPALTALHGRMEHPWTVESIAAEVAMSRSAFASRFSALVGSPPLQYLTHIRMERACTLLSVSSAPVKEISREIGYASEAAFSTAFRRQYSMAPIDFRRKNAALQEYFRREMNTQFSNDAASM
jgi:AraC-like DNA-binding protein